MEYLVKRNFRGPPIIKKKIITYGTVAFLLMLILFIIDVYKLYTEEKPPVPAVSVDGKQIEAVTGTYKWNGTKVKADEPVKLMIDLDGEKVDSQQKLKVTFPGKDQPKKITISQWNTIPGLEKLSQTGSTLTIPNSHAQPTLASYYKIKAEWDSNYSTYYVKLHVHDINIPFVDFLSKEAGKLSVLAILPSDNMSQYQLPSEIIKKLDDYQISTDLEEMKRNHPEIRASSTPIYYVFSSVSMIQSFDDKESIISMLEDRLQ
jgi:hypothetical protein